MGKTSIVRKSTSLSSIPVAQRKEQIECSCASPWTHRLYQTYNQVLPMRREVSGKESKNNIISKKLRGYETEKTNDPIQNLKKVPLSKTYELAD